MFVGRRKELELLEDAYRSPKSELVVIGITIGKINMSC
jgi:AAA+ ATPase superfamily predicted ATPase